MATLFAATVPVAVIIVRLTSSDTTGSTMVLVPASAVGLLASLRFCCLLLLLLFLSERAEPLERQALCSFIDEHCYDQLPL